MPWYHHIAAFLHHNLTHMRATKRANLALLTATILNRRARALSELARPWMPGLPQSHHQVCPKEYASASFASSSISALTPSGPNVPDARHLPPGRT